MAARDLTPAGDYHRQKRRLLAASLLVQTLFFLAFLFWGIARALPAERLRFLAAFYLCWQAVLLPTRFLSGWRLEKKYGLLKQPFSSWVSDQLKGQALSFAFYLVAALVFYAVAEAWPVQGWWVLALFAFSFSTLVSTAFPVWILPLFYRIRPLENAALAARLEETLTACGLKKLPLFEWKLGEKTTRANAALTGFGATRRVLLADTLLAGYTLEEIRMVLAHEIGHHRHGHLWRSLAWEAVLAGGGFFLLFRLFGALLPLTGAQSPLEPAFFPLLAFLSFLSGLLAMPAHNALSRAHEREADRYALRRYPDLGVFDSLMGKLSRQNLADPSPAAWEEFLLYTHPSRARRVEHARRFLRMSLANSGAAH